MRRDKHFKEISGRGEWTLDIGVILKYCRNSY